MLPFVIILEVVLEGPCVNAWRRATSKQTPAQPSMLTAPSHAACPLPGECVRVDDSQYAWL